MRAGIGAGRALVSCLRRGSHTPPQSVKNPIQFSESVCSSLLSNSGGSGFRNKWIHGLDLARAQRSLAPFALLGVVERSFSVSRVEGAVPVGWFRPSAQNHVFLLQGLATRTSVRPQTRTQTPVDSKPASDTKPPLTNASSLPPPPPRPPTGMGKQEEKPGTKGTGIVKQTLLDFGAVPFPALALGIAGLIPFVALAPPLAQMLQLPDILDAGHANAQAAYGASIISFLGAIHWGLAMADYAAPGKGGVANATLMTFRYAWSVVPSLMAWTALLLPVTTKFAVLIVSLWMVLGVDVLFAKLKLMPYWYLSLRWPLTLVASASMIPSMLAAATWML